MPYNLKTLQKSPEKIPRTLGSLMTKFHLALVIGFFLGSLTTILALGIIQTYVEEREEKNFLARNRTSRESRDGVGMSPYTDHGLIDHFSALAFEEPERKWTRRPPSP
jgi:hypothetical protein